MQTCQNKPGVGLAGLPSAQVCRYNDFENHVGRNVCPLHWTQRCTKNHERVRYVIHGLIGLVNLLRVAVSSELASSHHSEGLQLKRFQTLTLFLGAGTTDSTGLVTLSNYTLKGPAGLYTVVPSVLGVESQEASF